MQQETPSCCLTSATHPTPSSSSPSPSKPIEILGFTPTHPGCAWGKDDISFARIDLISRRTSEASAVAEALHVPSGLPVTDDITRAGLAKKSQPADINQLWPQLQALVEPYGLRRPGDLSEEEVSPVRQKADDLREPDA